MKQWRPLVKKLLVFAGLLVLGGLLVVVLASCGSEGASSPGVPSEQTTSTAGSDRTETRSSSPAQLSGDGRYFGFIRAATVDPPTISFDVAQKFSNPEASIAAAEDGVIPEGEGVPNDHYERNPDTQVAVLELARDAWTPKGPLLGEQVEAELADFLASFSDSGQTNLNSDYRGIHSQYWVTIRHGVVVRIDEQYFP